MRSFNMLVASVDVSLRNATCSFDMLVALVDVFLRKRYMLRVASICWWLRWIFP